MKGQENDPIINEVSLATITGVNIPEGLTIVIGKPLKPENLIKRTFKNKVRKKNT